MQNVEIDVLSYTVMFGGVLKRWEEPFLAILYDYIYIYTHVYAY